MNKNERKYELFFFLICRINLPSASEPASNNKATKLTKGAKEEVKPGRKELL